MNAIRVSFARCPVCDDYVPVKGQPSADALRFALHYGATGAGNCDGSLIDARRAVRDLIRSDIVAIKDNPRYSRSVLEGAQAQLAAVEASLAKDGAR